MPIAGIGTDIVEIDRIRQIYLRHPEKFISRILSESEQRDFAEIDNKAAFLAKRFAAKEAAAKALGTGIGEHAAFVDFSVTHSAEGQPILDIQGRAKALMQQRNLVASHISLSDESALALAFVVFETA
ncbi:MAG TPA: holo-ACP synthase [Gammaproteobacteria bacterium]|nr:holo-ACP synthase [Gammaproteobacteria bacterium]